MSTIRYTENGDWDQIPKIQLLIMTLQSPYITVFRLAQNAVFVFMPYSTQAPLWHNLMGWMKGMRDAQPEEYLRFKKSLIEIFSRYKEEHHAQWFTRDFLLAYYALSDVPFFEDVARVGKYTAKEIRDCKPYWVAAVYAQITIHAQTGKEGK
ncbi:hypothetical protein HDV00_007365 [Rhizophlyctis rosea]|nr:hypothetical protein HDV00_007365 [Rhizophlyctis rosea]